MRCIVAQISILAMLAAGGCALADGTNAPPEAPATNSVVTVPSHRTVWKGFLFAVPTNSAAGVVAGLKEEKHQKSGTYLLRTEDPILTTRLRDLSQTQKNAAVVLSGELDPAVHTILVTGLLELPKDRKPERK